MSPSEQKPQTIGRRNIKSVASVHRWKYAAAGRGFRGVKKRSPSTGEEPQYMQGQALHHRNPGEGHRPKTQSYWLAELWSQQPALPSPVHAHDDKLKQSNSGIQLGDYEGQVSWRTALSEDPKLNRETRKGITRETRSFSTTEGNQTKNKL